MADSCKEKQVQGSKFKVGSRGQGAGYPRTKCAGLNERCAKKRETMFVFHYWMNFR